MSPHVVPAAGLFVLGLFFSLGLFNPFYVVLARFLPGFSHFRVPARWLALTAVGGAGLAGWGAERVWGSDIQGSPRIPFWITAILVVAAGWAGLGTRLVGGGGGTRSTLIAWILSIGAAVLLVASSNWVPKLACWVTG